MNVDVISKCLLIGTLTLSCLLMLIMLVRTIQEYFEDKKMDKKYAVMREHILQQLDGLSAKLKDEEQKLCQNHCALCGSEFSKNETYRFTRKDQKVCQVCYNDLIKNKAEF